MVERILSVVGNGTYKMFAKRYKIKLFYVKQGKRIKKKLNELKNAIYDYEEKNNVTDGLYF